MKQQRKNKSVAERFQKFLEDCAPPGIGVGKELQGFFTGLMVTCLLSLTFFNRYSNAKALLYYVQGSKRVLKEGAVMTEFSVVLGDSLNSFWFFCFLLSGVVLWHYLCYRQGSKSFYLMKRLPNRFEIHKRAWTLPLLAVAVTVVVALVVLVFYYEFYMIATPKQCIAPGQWQNIWR